LSATGKFYFLQLASYVNYRFAERLYNLVCFRDTYVMLVRTGTRKSYYAVRIGPFRSYDKAFKAKKRAGIMYGLSAQILKRDYEFPESTLRNKRRGIYRSCFCKSNFFKRYSLNPALGKRYVRAWKKNFPLAPCPEYLDALIDFKNGNYNATLEKAESALLKGMDEPEVLTVMALSLLEENNLKKALTYFQMAFEKKRSFENFVNYVSIVLETGNVTLASKLVDSYGPAYSHEHLYTHLKNLLIEAQSVQKEVRRSP